MKLHMMSIVYLPNISKVECLFNSYHDDALNE